MATLRIDPLLVGVEAKISEKTEALHKYAALIGFAWRRTKNFLKFSVTQDYKEIDDDDMLLDIHGEYCLCDLGTACDQRMGVPWGTT